jgi:hypothetical protein
MEIREKFGKHWLFGLSTIIIAGYTASHILFIYYSTLNPAGKGMVYHLGNNRYNPFICYPLGFRTIDWMVLYPVYYQGLNYLILSFN